MYAIFTFILQIWKQTEKLSNLLKIIRRLSVCVGGWGGVQDSNPRLSSTVDPHYSGTLNLWICPLVKIYLQPPNQHSWHFPSHSQTCAEWQEMWITYSLYTVSAMVEQGDILPYCFKSHVINKCPFWGLVSATFFNFDAFYWCCCY